MVSSGVGNWHYDGHLAFGGIMASGCGWTRPFALQWETGGFHSCIPIHV